MPRGSVSAKPVLGYPTMTAAILALREQDLSHREIAEKIGCPASRVGAILSQQKKRAELRAARAPDHKPDAMPGLWTTEKMEKARRLYGQTLIYIADALQVPAHEFLTYVIHGVTPPARTIVRPEDIEWRQPALPAPEPSRDDDEAELAALEDVQDEDDFVDVQPETPAYVAPSPELARTPTEAEWYGAAPKKNQPAVAPADPGPVADADLEDNPNHLVRLVDELGRFVHESLDGMTTNPRFAWTQPRHKLKAVLNRLPHLRQHDVVVVRR